jgi:CHAT domain-containing protein/tetratricopeptide (TPR) repeat protein
MRACVCLILCLSCLPHLRAADPALLELGRRYTAQLKLDPAADAALFQSVGFDRAAALLMAVVDQGQQRGATAEDWTNLHRATAGLVELSVQKGEIFKASMFANFQSTFYHNLEGDHARALEASRQALELQQKSGVTGTLDICWISIADNLKRLGRLDEALESYRQARTLQEDPYTTRAAVNWRTIVLTELALQRPAEVKQELDRFRDLAHSGPPYFRAQEQMAEADVLIHENNYNGALDAIQSARQTAKADPKADSLDMDALNTLMVCVLDSMNVLPYAEAMALAKRMDTEFKGLPIEISIFAQLAMRTRRRLAGDIEGLLHEDNERVELARKNGNVRLQIEALRSLATTYRAFHSDANEVAALEEALTLERTLLPANGIPENSVLAQSWARSLNGLGDVYTETRQLGKATKAYDEAIHSIDAQTSAATKAELMKLRTEAVLGKSQVAAADDDPDTARDLLQGTLKAGSYDRSTVLLLLARVERDEHPDLAARDFDESINGMHAGRDLRSETFTRLEAARFLTQHGKLAEARAHVAAAAEEAAKSNLVNAQWRIPFISGMIAEKEHHDEEAVRDFDDAITKLDAIRARLTQEEHRQALNDNESVTELYQRMVAALTRLGRKNDAWRYVERGKARAFVEGLEGRKFHENIAEPAASKLAALEKKIVGLRVDLAPGNESLVRGAGREPAALKNDLNDLESRFALEREQAGLSASRGSRATQLEPPPSRAIEAKLARNTAVVEYSLLPDGLTAFVITKDSVDQVVWTANTKKLRASVLRLRTLLADGNSGDELGPVLKEVSETVWKPVAAKIGRAITRLVIVPAEYLNYLPFQTLDSPEGGSLVDRFSISYLPSAATLALLGDAPKVTRDLFLGALGNVSVEGWAPLPGTLRETDGIAKVYPEAARASEKLLTHDRAAQALREHQEVHFATHGLLDEHTPLFSALLVSPAAGQPSRLSMYELMDMDVHARLVVLSACETGLGQLLGGDEVAGLTRTILSAGASTVVSSLWKVSDDATALLMQGFYRRLRVGDRPADAMRAAALEVKKKFPHPFYWAPFLVTGAI